MKQVQDKDHFKLVRDSIHRQFDIDLKLPNNVFRQVLCFVFLDFDAYQLPKFYEALTALSNSFILSTLDPDPIDYFHYHFEEFGTITFSKRDPYQSYLDMLWLEPNNGNSADSIISRADLFVLLSDDESILAYGDRASECLILGFKDLDVKKNFVQQYGEDRIFSIEEAIVHFLPDIDKYAEIFRRSFDRG